jgi:glycosyltransferase involved in cell wall biosynthesis
LVAGRVGDREVGLRVAEAAVRDTRIRALPEFVADERVAELFAAADAAVLARSEVWTSGSLILALSLGVPAVAARMSPYSELIGPEAAGWLFEPDDVGSLRAALERAAADQSGARNGRSAAACDRAAQLPSWPQMAQATADLMLAAAGREAR